MKIRIAAGVILVLAACSEAPTGVSAAGPSFDDAYVIGSGNRSGDSTVSANTSNPEVTGENETTPATNADGAAAGGTYVIGSGN
jgi:hypothetical protein